MFFFLPKSKLSFFPCHDIGACEDLVFFLTDIQNGGHFDASGNFFPFFSARHLFHSKFLVFLSLLIPAS